MADVEVSCIIKWTRAPRIQEKMFYWCLITWSVTGKSQFRLHNLTKARKSIVEYLFSHFSELFTSSWKGFVLTTGENTYTPSDYKKRRFFFFLIRGFSWQNVSYLGVGMDLTLLHSLICDGLRKEYKTEYGMHTLSFYLQGFSITFIDRQKSSVACKYNRLSSLPAREG